MVRSVLDTRLVTEVYLGHDENVHCKRAKCYSVASSFVLFYESKFSLISDSLVSLSDRLEHPGTIQKLTIFKVVKVQQ